MIIMIIIEQEMVIMIMIMISTLSIITLYIYIYIYIPLPPPHQARPPTSPAAGRTRGARCVWKFAARDDLWDLRREAFGAIGESP